MCVLGKRSFIIIVIIIREETLKALSQSAGQSTQLFAESTTLVQVQLLLERVFTSLLHPLPSHPCTWGASSPVLTSPELGYEVQLIPV